LNELVPVERVQEVNDNLDENGYEDMVIKYLLFTYSIKIIKFFKVYMDILNEGELLSNIRKRY
jgi:hypothetical protein